MSVGGNTSRWVDASGVTLLGYFAICVGVVIFAYGVTVLVRVSRAHSFIDNAKTFAVKDFFDPSSAQFRSLHVVRVDYPKKHTYELMLCGETNGRNRYGAYTGFKPFVVIAPQGDVGMRAYIVPIGEHQILDAAGARCGLPESPNKEWNFKEVDAIWDSLY